ncbi:hypothetical protein ACWEN3_04720 [Streptomyces sp. NPDC004561]
MQGLPDFLAPDAVALSDGGGIKHAVPQATVGPGRRAACRSLV